MKLKLLKFVERGCPFCKWVEDSGVYDRFARKHPEVKLETLLHSERANALAAKFRIRAAPTVLFVDGDDKRLGTFLIGREINESKLEGAFREASEKVESRGQSA